jgi:hypothetical protein
MNLYEGDSASSRIKALFMNTTPQAGVWPVSGDETTKRFGVWRSADGVSSLTGVAIGLSASDLREGF